MASQAVPDSQTESPRNFDELWDAALRRYEQETKKKLLKLDLAKAFPSRPSSADEVIERFKQQNQSFETFRNRGQKVLRVLKPIVHFVRLFVDTGAEVAAASKVPGGKAIFTAVGVLLQATKGVSGLYDAIEHLFREITSYLNRVSVYLQPSMPPTPDLMDILVRAFVQVLDVLAMATKYCDVATVESDSGIKRGWNVIVRRTKDYLHEFTGDEAVKSALEKLRELTSAELLAAVAQTNAIVRKIHPWLEFIYESAVVEKVCSWLRAPSQQYLNYEKKRKPNSCKWFFDHRFEHWKKHKNGVYWVYGNAGAGKSVLSSAVIDMLKTDASLFLAYFYLDYSDLQNQDCRALASSLVSQLATCSDACLAYLQQECSSGRSDQPPTYERLLAMLSHLLCLSGRTFIVIDALDECPEARREKDLLPFLEHMCALDSEKKDLHVFVTSRPETDIQDYMLRFSPISLSFHDAVQHKAELDQFITAQLAVPKLGWWSDALKLKVQKVLRENSNGMFLWVDLQFRRLKRCISTHDVEQALTELPSGLNGTYERMLAGPDTPVSSIDRTRQVFQCIAFSMYPLSLAQVLEIFSVTFVSSTETVIDPDLPAHTIDVQERLVREQGVGLLDIITTERGTTVGFIHFSVREYIISTELSQATTIARRYSFDEYSANLTLARICLSALDGDASLPNLRIYANDRWRDHVGPRNEDALSGLLRRFLNLSSVMFAQWVQALPSYYRGTTFIECTALLGLCHHMKWILDTAQNNISAFTNVSRARNRHGKTILHFAARSRHVEICRVLLEHGALVDDADDNGNTPLFDAETVEVARLLLEYPATDGSSSATLRCRTRNKKGQTALHRAAVLGLTELCRLLLEHGALVDDADDDGETPLLNAKTVEVAHLLLEYPATDGSNAATLRCRTRNKKGQTALYRAASWGRTKVCRLLLEHGALVSDADDGGNTPLFVVASVEVTRLLLEYPATDGSNAATLRCRTRNKNGQTALHRAADYGCTEVCRLLLENGALVGDANENGDTPLFYAASVETARLLLEYPATDGSNVATLRCRTRNKKGRTALHRAASWGRVEVCRLLLENGAPVDDEDNDSKTPSQLATETWERMKRCGWVWPEHEDTIRILSGLGATDVTVTQSLESEPQSALSS